MHLSLVTHRNKSSTIHPHCYVTLVLRSPYQFPRYLLMFHSTHYVINNCSMLKCFCWHATVKFPRVNYLRNRLCALEVLKCINGIAPKAFENYFKRHNHKVNTRKNNKSAIVPKVRTETGRKTFSFQIFNNLPHSLQTEKSFLRFKATSKDTNLDFQWKFFNLNLLKIV